MTSPARRFTAALSSWAILFLASPGILSANGAGLLALVALVPWALVSSREGPRAVLVEWLAGAIGSAALCAWCAYVWSGTLLFLGLVPGLYAACAGSLLRLLGRRYPLAVAAPAAWVGMETLRVLVEPPLGFGWLRLGTCLHANEWLAGSARVFGTGGLSFAAAAFAGGLADLLRKRRYSRAARHRNFWAITLGILPLAACAALSRWTSAPAVQPGPRVLLVQPAFEQKRKMNPRDWRELAEESRALTARGIAENQATPPDLVAWGETMFPFPMAAEGLAAAYDGGARSPEWTRDQIQRDWIENMDTVEDGWIRTRILGPNGAIPAGTSFLSGVEMYAVQEDEIRRYNAVILWDPSGVRRGVGGKVHLVPGAEDLSGAERIGLVRAAASSLAGYVPDLAAFESAQVLELTARDGKSYRFGTSVCFDNAYDDPYTGPLREGALDFHLVCSNEAWYEKSYEYDQMIAFSRLLAIATGRSIVRATNAGISVVLDPEGREIARLSVAGPGGEAQDRLVAGTLCAVVPVPAEGTSASKTPFVRHEKAWLALWIGLPILLAFLVVRGGYTARDRG